MLKISKNNSSNNSVSGTSSNIEANLEAKAHLASNLDANDNLDANTSSTSTSTTSSEVSNTKNNTNTNNKSNADSVQPSSVLVDSACEFVPADEGLDEVAEVAECGSSEVKGQLPVSCSPRLKDKIEVLGLKRLLGTFVILSFSLGSKRGELFLYLPNSSEGTLYYGINDGLKVRSVFIEFVILVLKSLKWSDRLNDAFSGIKDQHEYESKCKENCILFPSRGMDASTRYRLNMFFDYKLIPYLRREVSGVDSLRTHIAESNPLEGDFESSVRDSIGVYYKKLGGSLVSECIKITPDYDRESIIGEIKRKASQIKKRVTGPLTFTRSYSKFVKDMPKNLKSPSVERAKALEELEFSKSSKPVLEGSRTGSDSGSGSHLEGEV